MLTHLEQKSSEVILENPYWQYRKDTYSLPNGKEGDYHYIHTPGSVFVIPVTDDGNLILLRQYRYLNRRESIEFIGGGIKQGHSAEAAARAELSEEAGITAKELLKIGEFNPFNGVTDEICTVFVAKGLRFGAARPEESEEFEQLEHPPQVLREMIARGEIWDGMTLAAFALYDSLNR
jgi:ADP-ribose pyrophosphatase